MNRKLFNGLLLLTVATGGIGTFTSCKDTEQDFRNEVLTTQEGLKVDLAGLSAEIDAIRQLTDANFLSNLDAEIIKQVKEGNFEDAEFYLKLKGEIETLLNDDYASLEDLMNAVNDLKDANAQNKTEIMNEVGEKLSELQTTILGNVSGMLSTLESDLKAWVDSRIEDAIDLEPLWSKINEVKGIADEALEKANAADATANEALEQALFNAGSIERLDVNISVLQGQLAELTGEVGVVKENIATMQERLELMSNDVDDLKTKYNDLDEALKGVRENVNTLTESVNDLTSRVETAEKDIKGLKDATEQLSNDFNDYKTKNDEILKQYREEIDALNLRVTTLYNNLMQKFANLVTSINVEEVQNAIFGSFSFPVGIESNIVANYYAKSDHNVVFPPRTSTYEYYSSNPVLAGINLDRIEAPTFTQEADEINLEKLADMYLTVNPANRDFSDLELSLVNSQDEQVLAGFKLKKTDHVVTMGVTRAADNGFYAAEMVSSNPSKDVPAIVYEIENGLGSAFKDALKNRKKSDFVELAKLIVKQFGNDLPAYAVKCEWDEDIMDKDGNVTKTKNSVRSGYDLAVTTFRPLSYRTGWGFSTSVDLPTPTMGYIRDRIKSAFNDIRNRLDLGLTGIELDSISIELNLDITVDPTQITIDLSNSPVYSAPIEWYNPEDPSDFRKDPNYPNAELIGFLGEGTSITIGYDPNGNLDSNETALNGFVDSIIESIKGSIQGDPEAGKEGIADQITSQINEQLEKIVNNINEQLEGVQSKVDNTIADIENKINGTLDGRFGRLSERVLNLYSRLVDKLNEVLADPNHYLQIMMAYMGNDNELHRLSTMADDATPLKVGRTMEIFATSYNAEILVPSYKKYVAVVDATDANGKWGDYAAAKKVNDNTNYLNEVRPGEQQRFYIDGSKLEAGHIYKILYSSLDYRGYTSSMVYYVRATK